MKSLKMRLLLLCVGTLLTLGLSHAVALADCADVDAGSNVYGSWDCRLTGQDKNWCYYDCTCSDLFPGYKCSDVLTQAGFILN